MMHLVVPGISCLVPNVYFVIAYCMVDCTDIIQVRSYLRMVAP